MSNHHTYRIPALSRPVVEIDRRSEPTCRRYPVAGNELALRRPVVEIDRRESRAITPNRITIHLQGRNYPLPEPTDLLPSSLSDLPGRLFDVTPFSPHRSQANRDKPALFRLYAETIEEFARYRGEFDRVLERAAGAGGFSNPAAMRFENGVAARAEWYGESQAEILRAMTLLVKMAAEDFVLGMANALDEAVAKNHVGIIDWPAAGACRYHYFIHKDETSVVADRSKRNETVSGRTHTVKSTTDKDYERVVSLTRHVHDLIEAKKSTVPFRGRSQSRAMVAAGKLPARVQPVIEALPDWLPAEFVDGQQIREQRIEREISRQQWNSFHQHVSTWEEPPPVVVETPRYRYDPAIVVGHYVLVGWNPDEKSPCSRCDGTGKHRLGVGAYSDHTECYHCKGTGREEESLRP